MSGWWPAPVMPAMTSEVMVLADRARLGAAMPDYDDRKETLRELGPRQHWR
ncbi:MAG: hypothetical protein K0V04_14495 [Deltaproteobacteria bacterium]|nr:hypothetical protein [Deltaproteobacteria bacterium]